MSNLKKTEKVKNDGVYVYLGPSIRGVIQTGAIYRGTRDEVLKSLAEAISKFPKIATLIVEDCDIARRISESEKYKALHYPMADVYHLWERGSKKSRKLLMIHIKSIITYFLKWGFFG